MRPRNKASLVVVTVMIALAGCSESSTTTPSRSSGDPSRSVATDVTDRGAKVLETGKSDLALAPGTYRSPRGFAPALHIVVSGSGWLSTHRGSDGFDLSRPDPTKDAPLVALVVVRPPEAGSGAAFAAVQARAAAAKATVRPGMMTVAGVDAQVIDVQDGQGPLVTSAAGGIALDAGQGQRTLVAVVEIKGQSLVVAVFVPDQTRWNGGLGAAMALIASLKPA